MLQPVPCGFDHEAPNICFRTGAKVRDDVISQLIPWILTNVVLSRSAIIFNIPPIIDPIRPPIAMLTDSAGYEMGVYLRNIFYQHGFSFAIRIIFQNFVNLFTGFYGVNRPQCEHIKYPKRTLSEQ